MTRFLIGDPDAAARTAKNAHAASGLPTRTANRSLGRNPMVRTTTCDTEESTSTEVPDLTEGRDA